MNGMKPSVFLIAFLTLTASSSAGWTASTSSTGSPAASQTARAAVPTARYSSTIRTPNGRAVIVISTSSVPRGAPLFRITGVPAKTASIWCDPTGNQTDYFDCYDCGNQSVDVNTPYSQACTYLGFCTNGYNGNSSYCSF